MLGLAFMLGALTGVLALLPTLFRLRRELARAPRATELDTVTQATDMPVV
jgi:lipopolysaccharide assembly protein A